MHKTFNDKVNTPRGWEMKKAIVGQIWATRMCFALWINQAKSAHVALDAGGTGAGTVCTADILSPRSATQYSTQGTLARVNTMHCTRRASPTPRTRGTSKYLQNIKIPTTEKKQKKHPTTTQTHAHHLKHCATWKPELPDNSNNFKRPETFINPQQNQLLSPFFET